MLAVVPSRRRWLAAHPLDVAIVVLTPPFGSGLLRLLRLVRLLRLAQLARGLFSFAGVRYAALLAVLTAFAGQEAFAVTASGSARRARPTVRPRPRPEREFGGLARGRGLLLAAIAVVAWLKPILVGWSFLGAAPSQRGPCGGHLSRGGGVGGWAGRPAGASVGMRFGQRTSI